MNLEPLEPLERAALEKFLDGNHPTLAILREQLDGLSVVSREYTVVGCYTDFEVAAAKPKIASNRLVLYDLEVTVDGIQGGMNLFIIDGRIATLEGFSYGPLWPPSISRFDLRYSDPARLRLWADLGSG
jgi:hypothetical protein